MMRFCSIFAFWIMFFAVPASAVTYTYAWVASNLEDSSGNPPPNANSSLSGFFTIDLNTSDPTNKIDLLVADASNFTNVAGATLGPSEIGYSVTYQNPGQQVISVGGLINTASFIVGQSNDFRLDFLVNWGTGVTPTVISSFGFFPYTQSNAGFAVYNADLAVTLQDSSAIPIPGGLPLLSGALVLFAIFRRLT